MRGKVKRVVSERGEFLLKGRMCSLQLAMRGREGLRPHIACPHRTMLPGRSTRQDAAADDLRVHARDRTPHAKAVVVAEPVDRAQVHRRRATAERGASPDRIEV